MTTEITATEAARNLSEYLNRVAYRGERFVIRRGKQLLAELAPPNRVITGAELADAWERMPHMTADEADAFARDVEEGTAWINSQPVISPWDR